MQTQKPQQNTTQQTAPEQQSLAGNPAISAAEKLKVDRLFEIDQELAKVAPLIKEAKGLKEFLAGIAADDARFPNKQQPAILEGNVAKVEFSAASEGREITDMNGLVGLLKAKLGYDGMLALVKVTLGDMDKYLKPHESAPFVSDKIGSRSLKNVHAK